MSRIDVHVAAVRRKLAVSVFLHWLAVCLFVAATSLLLVILADRLLNLGLPTRWIWVFLPVAAVAALVMMLRRAPTQETAAVAIDQRLGLKEKFITALQVRSLDDPFARAMVADAEQTADAVQLAGRFPLEMPRLGRLAGAMLALAAAASLLPQYDLLGRGQRQRLRLQQEAQITEVRDQVALAIQEIQRMPAALRDSEPVRLAAAELQRAMDDVTADPQAARRAADEALTRAQEAQRQSIERARAYTLALEVQSMLSRITKPAPEVAGPVADFRRELAAGKIKDLPENVRKAFEKFKDLDDAQQDQSLADLEKLAQDLQAIADDPRLASRRDLQELSRQLAQDAREIAGAMRQMRGGAAPRDGGDADQQLAEGMKDMGRQLRRLGRMLEPLDGWGPDGAMAREGQGGRWRPEGGFDPEGGLNGFGRGDKAPVPYGTRPELSPSEFDEDGQIIAARLMRDRSAAGVSRLEMEKMIAAGQANAGGDVDDTKIDRRSHDIAREYFRVMKEGASR